MKEGFGYNGEEPDVLSSIYDVAAGSIYLRV